MQGTFTITFNITPEPLQIANSTFSGTVGQPITGSLGISGGVPPDSVAVTSGLPDGVTIDAQGNVSGTPTTAGTFTSTVTVVDSQG